jgi:hypothetical protein
MCFQDLQDDVAQQVAFGVNFGRDNDRIGVRGESRRNGQGEADNHRL